MKKITTILMAFLFSFSYHGFSQNWLLTGNSGTNSSSNFVGTTDTQRLVFRTNNVERATILSGGYVGIGTSAPSKLFSVYSTTADTHLGIGGTAPSVTLFSGATINPISFGRIGLATSSAAFVSTSVTGDFVIQNLDTATSLIFGTNRAGTNGAERMRINSSGYVGIATTSPTAKLDINCVAVAGKSNPSNIRFENLQKGAGTVLVIDSNGYVYKAASGTSASVVQTPLSTDLQDQVENLKNQVQELRALLSNRLQLTPAQLNSLNAHSSAWLGDNKPNPANGSTTIEYSLPTGVGAASFQIYSLDGKRVNTVNLSPASGKAQIQLGTNNLNAGMYIYSLIIDGKVADTKKMVVSN